jgi:endonuclease YncB( thermonuclease family)
MPPTLPPNRRRRRRAVVTAAAAMIAASVAGSGTLLLSRRHHEAAPPQAAEPRVSLALPPAAPEPAAADAPSPRLPDLPVREIPERPIHMVPPEPEAAPPKRLDLRFPPPGSSGAIADAAAGGRRLAGRAEATGATALRIDGRPVRLFGVRPPAVGDRCAAAAAPEEADGRGAAAPCGDRARDALVARLKAAPGRGEVSCRLVAAAGGPESGGAAAAAAVCLDAGGVDLAGFLVGEGLALADPAQGRDYAGAERVARSLRKGLWLYR